MHRPTERECGIPYAAADRAAGGQHPDLLQAARDGAVDALARAARCFDPSRGVTFVTYAWRACAYEAWKAVAREHRRRARESLSVEALAAARNVPEDAVLGPDAGPGPAELAERADLSRLALRLLEGLPAPERWAVRLRVLGGLTLAEAALALGVSKECVRKWAEQGLAALREQMREVA